ncbi:CAP domain-containing protein [Aminobacter niigataensis]|uniref:CAP domain-containing protein n=1 Tax=Aminobacter niigataensis TaxID=83265 RepID=UPI0024CC185B|nr:CAP domain-containing protein [Aminobacter niigataensis]CAI2935619.1 Cysteine-rich secretory protein family protein [Aminobacter niigataensis]
MPQHSANEQYLLELINAERAKTGAQPLAFDNDLSEAAENHDRWMLSADVFSHTGSGGTSPTTRMKAAGYTLSGSWATGENIAWATTRAPTGYTDEVKLLHTNLMNSSGHRANILNPNFREVGLGYEVGDYKGRSSAFVTEDFAKTGSDLFLTGVAFDDKDGDRFYDPGEGLGAVTVTAKNSAGQTFKTTTSAAGGYDLVLKPGTYTVTFSGANIATSTQTATIGTKNVKKDLIDPVMKSGTLAATDSAEDAATAAPTAPTKPVDVADNTDTGSTGGNSTGGNPANNWLADFFKKMDHSGQDQGTRGAREVAGSADATAKKSVAFDGDHFNFSSKVAAHVNADQVNDIADGGHVQQAVDHVIAALQAHLPADGHAVADTGDAAQAAVAKILAQMAAHSGHQNADLVA